MKNKNQQPTPPNYKNLLIGLIIVIVGIFGYSLLFKKKEEVEEGDIVIEDIIPDYSGIEHQIKAVKIEGEGWTKLVDDNFTTQYGSKASSVVQTKINEIIKSNAWVEKIEIQAGYEGIPLAEYIVRSALSSRLSSCLLKPNDLLAWRLLIKSSLTVRDLIRDADCYDKKNGFISPPPSYE